MLADYYDRARAEEFRRLRQWSHEPAGPRKQAVEYAKLSQQLQVLSKSRSRTAVRGKDRIQAQVDSYPHAVTQLCNEYELTKPVHLHHAGMYNDLEESVDRMQQWCERMVQFKAQLHDTGRLHYRLYLEMDGREIDLAVTDGYGG